LHQHVGFAEPRAVGGSFDDAEGRVAEEFDAFAAPYRQAAGAEWTDTIDRAALLNWSCVVGPRGHFQRPSMLMSKNWMSNVWGWDHAINALALSEHHPELAWDQLLTIFDQQLPTGQIPDFINDAVRLYNYIKPPIHGWILGLMLDRNPWFDDPTRLAAFYGPLERWTEWWCRFRLREGLGLPEYYHGNDCGWDNGTVFDAGTPAVSPDAAAFLVLQMEMLARLARRLGRAEAAETWQVRSREMLAKLVKHLWDGRRFVVLNAEGRIAERSDSIFGSLPIVLGRRLPGEVRAGLVAEIRRHVTEWGLATEHPGSPLYEKAGYWRGPIWAPPTLIVVEGLRDAGEAELAADIAGRYCRLCQKSGFAENFDALSGEPLCDPAYTWTASVFLEMFRIK
jgi:putative isomerase